MSAPSMKVGSSLIKRTGAKFAPRVGQHLHHELVAELASHPGFATMFVQVAASLLPDASLTPTEKIVFIGVKFLIWYQQGKCTASREVVGCLCNVSTRTAKSAIAKLCRQGKLIRVKSRNPALPDTLTDSAEGQPIMRRRDLGLNECSRCSARRPINAVGICGVCRKQEIAEREVADYLADEPSAPIQCVFLHLKTFNSKSSPNDIRRAFAKLTESAA